MKKFYWVSVSLLVLALSSVAGAGGKTLEKAAPVSQLPSSYVPAVGEVILGVNNGVGLVVKDNKNTPYGKVSYVGLADWADGAFYPLSIYRRAKPHKISNVATIEYENVVRAVPSSKSGLSRGERVENAGKTGTVYFVFSNEKVIVKWTHKNSLALDKFSFFELVDADVLKTHQDSGNDAQMVQAVSLEGSNFAPMEGSPTSNLSMNPAAPYTLLPLGTVVRILKQLTGPSIAWVQNGAQFFPGAVFAPPVADAVYCAFSNDVCFNAQASCTLGPLANGVHFLGSGSTIGLQCFRSKGVTTYNDLLKAVGSLVAFQSPT